MQAITLSIRESTPIKGNGSRMVSTRSKSSQRKASAKRLSTEKETTKEKSSFDFIPLTKAELLQWRGLFKWFIVNAFTLGTIFTGFILMVVPTPYPAILTATVGLEDKWTPCILVAIAVCCDIADGKLARAWAVQSKVGATFDGLADMMAFGVAPAIYYALKFKHIGAFPLFAATVYVGAAVYRISRFLVLTFQYYNFTFKGMPTNLAGCLAHVSILCFGFDHWIQPWVFCVLSALMVSAIPFEKPWFLQL